MNKCYRHLRIPLFFGGDAAFAVSELHGFLEGETFSCAFRLQSHTVLERNLTALLKRPVGRPSLHPRLLYHRVCTISPVLGINCIAWWLGPECPAGELFPPVRLLFTKSLLAIPEDGRVLRRSWVCRSVDQSRQPRGEVNDALLPYVPGQPSPRSSLCVGRKPEQLPAATGLAETGPVLVADDAARKADQDRGQGSAAHQVRVLSTGIGGRDTKLVCHDPRPHHTVGNPAAGARKREGMVDDGHGRTQGRFEVVSA